MTFGLGARTQADRLVVAWPDGTQERFEDVAGNRAYRLVQGTGRLDPAD